MGDTIGDIERDTKGLDYSSCRDDFETRTSLVRALIGRIKIVTDSPSSPHYKPTC